MRLKLTDRRIEKLHPRRTTEYWDTELRGFGIRINRGGRKSFMLVSRGKRHTIGQYPALRVCDARAEASRVLNGTPTVFGVSACWTDLGH